MKFVMYIRAYLIINISKNKLLWLSIDPDGWITLWAALLLFLVSARRVVPLGFVCLLLSLSLAAWNCLVSLSSSSSLSNLQCIKQR